MRGAMVALAALWLAAGAGAGVAGVRAERDVAGLLPPDLLGVEWRQDAGKTRVVTEGWAGDAPWVEGAESVYELGLFWISPMVLRSDKGRAAMVERIGGWGERMEAAGTVRDVVRVEPEGIAGCAEVVGFSAVRLDGFMAYDTANVACVVGDDLVISVDAGHGTLAENLRMNEAAIRAVLELMGE